MKILSVLVLIVLTEALVPSGNDATTPLSQIRTVLGSAVAGHDYNGSFKSLFRPPDIPKIYQASLDTAMNAYKSTLNKYQPNYNSSNFNEVLEKRYRVILEKDIRAFYDQWKQGLLETHKKIHEIEARNMQEMKIKLDESQQRFANITGKLEADKRELLAKQQTREKEIYLNMQLKDKEKEEYIKKIHDEMRYRDIIYENERQQSIAQQKAEYERILTDAENRRLNAEDEVNQAIADRERSNAEFQMQLQKESDERFERMKQEAKEREKDRKMDQERRAKEDADRAEELRLLRNKLERIERERDRQQQQQQFQAGIDSLRREFAATTESPNLFYITFAVGVFSVLIILMLYIFGICGGNYCVGVKRI